MTLRASTRPLLIRAAAALRRAGAALARRARAPGRARPEAPGPSPAGEGDGAFLTQVKETLLEISAGPEAAPVPGPTAPQGGTGRRARMRRLAALLEPVRRHEDLVLVVVLLLGIAMMILHWVP
ncbi:MAG TPA: hypothetical protein VFF02_04760 [Anaeromyxobacteraceae bacterium]|nr:hypothetical protein [Anaeromyxobacteraceae bacterium]